MMMNNRLTILLCLCVILLFSRASVAGGDGNNNPSLKSKFKDGRNYFRLGGSANIPFEFKHNSAIGKKPDITYAVDLGVGREVYPRFRLGVDYQYKPTKKVSETVGNTTTTWGYKSHTAMLRGSYDLLEHGTAIPYILAGAGFSILDSSDHTSSVGGTSTTYKGKIVSQFAWKSGLGLRLKSWQKINSFIEYSYVDRGLFKTKSSWTNGSTTSVDIPRKGNARAHNITAGISVNF